MEKGAVVAGGGPAGLAATYYLSRNKVPALLLEKDEILGGLKSQASWRSSATLGTRVVRVHREGDRMWEAPDDDLINLGREDLKKLGIEDESGRYDGFVMRYAKAYPVYDEGY